MDRRSRRYGGEMNDTTKVAAPAPTVVACGTCPHPKLCERQSLCTFRVTAPAPELCTEGTCVACDVERTRPGDGWYRGKLAALGDGEPTTIGPAPAPDADVFARVNAYVNGKADTLAADDARIAFADADAEPDADGDLPKCPKCGTMVRCYAHDWPAPAPDVYAKAVAVIDAGGLPEALANELMRLVDAQAAQIAALRAANADCMEWQRNAEADLAAVTTERNDLQRLLTATNEGEPMVLLRERDEARAECERMRAALDTLADFAGRLRTMSDEELRAWHDAARAATKGDGNG